VASGKDLFIDASRCYPDFETMMREERALDASERMDFVVVVTPNHLHFPAVMAALENGFHVVSDKPATFDLAEALRLQAFLQKSDLLYGLTHNYTGYPMVRQARAMVRNGELGKLRKIVVQYPQGWLAKAIEQDGQKQAAWRTDPKRSGAAGCIGDIGTHAHNLACYISGLELHSVAADLNRCAPGRLLDDDAQVLLRFSGGAKGVLQSSQIAVGEENALRIHLYGENGGLEWHQMEPNTLLVKGFDATRQFRTGVGDLAPEAMAATRLPAGHPEGYIEAFANIYRGFCSHLRSVLGLSDSRDPLLDYPGIDEGVSGMAFIEAVVASSANDAAWTELHH
jgi:predicted dehydrogenase